MKECNLKDKKNISKYFYNKKELFENKYGENIKSI